MSVKKNGLVRGKSGLSGSGKASQNTGYPITAKSILLLYLQNTLKIIHCRQNRREINQN